MPEFKYDAFISYRRLDGGRHARWLRRRLLDYRLPRALQPSQQKKPAVYLDTVYERATEDFFDAVIKPALRESAFLIIIGTPGATQLRADGSRNWLEREVEYFQTLPQGATGNVTIAWARGTHETEMMPAGVRERYPNVEIVDLRRLTPLRILWWAWQWQLEQELLKVVATVRNVLPERMPELRQEESRRQRLRAASIIVAAMAIITALALLSGWAVSLLVESRQQLVVSTTEQGRFKFADSPAAARLHFVRALEIAESGGALSRFNIAQAQPARLWLGRAYPETIASILWHHSPVKILRFSPDGRLLATGATDGSVTLWDPRNGTVRRALTHARELNGISFSPSGHLLATASSDGTAAVWEVDSGRRLSSWQHTQPIVSIHFDYSGTRILTGSRDNTAAVWEATTGRAFVPPWQNGEGVRTGLDDAVWDPRGERVATAGLNGEARIWDVSRGQANLLFRLVHRGPVRTVEFSPDGRHLLTASEDGSAQAWEVATGSPLGQPIRHGGNVECAHFNRAGDVVLSGSGDGVAKLSDPITGRQKGETQTMKLPDALRFAAFAAGGQEIVTGGFSNTAQRWDFSGRAIGNPLEFGGMALAVDSSPDARLIAVAAFDGSVRIIQRPAVRPAIRHDYAVSHLKFLAGDRLLTAATGGVCALWATRSGTQRWALNFKSNVKQLVVDASGSRFLANVTENSIRVRSTEDGGDLSPEFQHGAQINDASFDPSAAIVATAGKDGRVRLWNSASGTSAGVPLRHRGSVQSVDFHPTKPLLVTTTDQGAVLVWRTDQTRPQFALNLRIPLRSAQYCDEGRRILIVPDDGNCSWLYDSELQSQIATLGHRDYLSLARLNRPGSHIVTTSVDRELKVWDASSGRILWRLALGILDDAVLSADGRRVAVADLNGIQLWDLATAAPIGRPQGSAIRGVAISPDETVLGGGGADGSVVIAPCAPFTGSAAQARLLAEFSSALTMEPGFGIVRRLTAEDWARRRAQMQETKLP